MPQQAEPAAHERPQVGLLALQELAYPGEDSPLDVLGAETEGAIGYMIEQELGNLLPFERPFAFALIRLDGADITRWPAHRPVCLQRVQPLHRPLPVVRVLGDAGHPMIPFMGQGGAQAIEDAVAITACVSPKR